jgi:NAD(P)-dependent dehydrogenase (short-subunit alcohol dehydrogenase family)
MFETIKSQFGGLDIFVSNARATIATGFYGEPMEIPLEAWQATSDTQATEFLVAVRTAVPMMGKKGRQRREHRVIAVARDAACRDQRPLTAVSTAASARERWTARKSRARRLQSARSGFCTCILRALAPPSCRLVAKFFRNRDPGARPGHERPPRHRLADS